MSNNITINRGSHDWTLYKVPRAFAVHLEFISNPYNTPEALRNEFDISENINFYHIGSITNDQMEFFAVENQSDLNTLMDEIRDGLDDFEFVSHVYSSYDDLDIDKDFDKTNTPTGKLFIEFKNKTTGEERKEFYEEWGLAKEEEIDFIDNAYNVV